MFFLIVYEVIATPPMDVNLLMNIFMVTLLLAGAPLAFRASKANAQLQAKDGIIKTHEQNQEALHERINLLSTDLEGCRQRADRYHDRAKISEERATAAEAKYQEQSKYTAPEAIAEFNVHLGRIEELIRMWITREATESFGFPERKEKP